MSYFVGRGGSNTTTSSLAQATTNHFTVSRQASIDESGLGGPRERKSLLRTQTDSIAQVIGRNSSQTSLVSNSNGNTNVDLGGRYTFRGIARALPYFFKSTPSTTTVSVASEVVERNVVSSSLSQSVVDSQSEVPAPAIKQSSPEQKAPVPVKNMKEEAESVESLPMVEENLDSKIRELEASLEEKTEKIQSYQDDLKNSTETIDQLRISLDASQRDASEISKVAEERGDEIRRLREELSDLHKTNLALEEKVEEQVVKILSIEEVSEKERADLCTRHALDIDTQRRLVQDLQLTLELLQQDSGEKEEKLGKLMDERDKLDDQMKKLKERCRNEEKRAENLESNLVKANSGIRDIEEEARKSREEASNENTTYINQANELREQLDRVRKLLSDRDHQIQRLEMTNTELGDILEETKKGLNARDKRAIELDRTLAEARELAQAELDRAIGGIQRQREALQKQLNDRSEEVVKLREAAGLAMSSALGGLGKLLGSRR